MTRRGALAVAFAFAIGAAALATSCRQVAGIEDAPPEALTTRVCGVSYGSNACASCATSCCAESTACAGDAACSAYEDCLGGCGGDPECRSQCTIDHPASTPEVSALSACLASKCEAACGLGCGGFEGYVTEKRNAAACQSCVATTKGVCADARACATSRDCDGYWRCVRACPTEDCRLACATDNAAGAMIFANFQADYAGACSGPCAYGNYWPCVGQVSYPVAKSSTLNLTFPITYYSNQTNGVPGLDVSICGGCPCDNFPVLQKGMTDDGGIVSLPGIPQVKGVLGLNGCGEITSPTQSIVPYYAYWGYPLSEPTVTTPFASAAAESPQVLTPAQFAQYQGLLGLHQDDDKGYIAPIVHDCLGSPSPGVEVVLSTPNVSAVYGLGTELEATGSTGDAFFYNVPANGGVTVTASPLAIHGRASVVVVPAAAGVITGVTLFPTQL